MPPIVSLLLPLALQAGVPLLTKVLSGHIGNGNADLVGTVISTVAGHAGVTVDSLPEAIAASPAVVTEALKITEASAPELIALYAQGLEHQTAIMTMEQTEPWWAWAWRPAAMWGFGFLWLWNIVIIHVANAYWRLQLPETDLGLLFQLNAVYMGLYMGGHTVKDFVSKRWGTE